MTGIQLKLGPACAAYNVSTDADFDTYIEPYFQYSKELGYKTVIFPISWKHIEATKDNYDFSLLNRYYNYAKEYDLDIQLLWFGSNSCGHDSNMPNYILKDTETYSRLTSDTDVIDYSDADLIQRECLVFSKLLAWLYENDQDGRTVMIQLENEPNFNAAYGPDLDETDSDTYAATAWCAGQKDAILNIISKLATLVKTGQYRCVTRVNLATHNYIYNSTDRLINEANDVLSQGGVDIVGYDSYIHTVNTRELDCLNQIETNIAHWGEFGAAEANYVPMTLLALSKRAGVFGYQLKAVESDKTTPIFGGTDNTWTLPTGEAFSSNGNTYYRVDATELKALNAVLRKAGEKITLNDVNKTHVFNASQEGHDTYKMKRATDCSETTTIDGVSVSFTNSGATNYGGCGYATKVSDNEMLIFATRGTSNFTFTGKTISAESGSYKDGVWIKDADIAITNGGITISSDMANAGTLIRVTFN